MGKIILQENITPEGYCDHRAFVADAELMQSIIDLLGTVDKAMFGRVTFQLFENYWPSVWQSKNAPDSDVEFAGMMETHGKDSLLANDKKFVVAEYKDISRPESN